MDVFSGILIVLCCIVLCCAGLCCHVLCCVVLCCLVLCRVVPYCAVLCCAVVLQWFPMTARLLVTEQKPSAGWSQRQDNTTNTKPWAQMQVNQHLFGSTHISFVSYAEPFTRSASSMETCESERWFRACYFTQAKDWRITGYRTTAMPCSSGARDN